MSQAITALQGNTAGGIRVLQASPPVSCFMFPACSCDPLLCAGCLHEGVYRESGAQWRDPRRPCHVFSCKAGVVTETEEVCYTPCGNPRPPRDGQCCGTCKGEWPSFAAGREFRYFRWRSGKELSKIEWKFDNVNLRLAKLRVSIYFP